MTLEQKQEITTMIHAYSLLKDELCVGCNYQVKDIISELENKLKAHLDRSLPLGDTGYYEAN